nr:transposase [Nocardiopsis lucentensis]
MCTTTTPCASSPIGGVASGRGGVAGGPAHRQEGRRRTCRSPARPRRPRHWPSTGGASPVRCTGTGCGSCWSPSPCLKGILRRVRRRRSQRAALRSWAFAQLGGFITDKSRRAGVPVVFVNPAHSSRECAECSHTHRRDRTSQALFTCRSCGVARARRPERFPRPGPPRPGRVGRGAAVIRPRRFPVIARTREAEPAAGRTPARELGRSRPGS